MLSELRKKKFTRFFEAFDSNKDQKVTSKDIDDLASRLGALRGWAPKSPDLTLLHAAYRDLLQDLLKLSDANGDNEITLDEWLVGHEKLTASSPTAHKDVMGLVFELLDADGDGSISLKEYTDFLAAHLIPDASSVAEKAFKTFDTNADGKCSRQEIDAVVKDFFYSEDAGAAGNLLFG